MWPLLLFLSLFAIIERSCAINCYTCSSVNGSQPYCEDPIDATLTPLTEHCKVPKNNHQGMFPAIFCLKIVGKNIQTYERLVIRACAMTSMDNQCGVFKYEDSEMSGCVLTCDYSGCNTAVQKALAFSILFISSILSLVTTLGIFSSVSCR